MRPSRVASLSLLALLILCFGLAAYLDTWFQAWAGNRAQSNNLLSVLLGDSRRMFANHFFVKADAYFHSGYYPSVFDNREAFRTPHMAEDANAMAGHNEGDETGFLGKPRDWIDAFSRQFFPSKHTHLDEGGVPGNAGETHDLGASSEVREILPWLRLSAELDPNRVETYTVTAYWLRRRMGRVAEAEQFLREGLRANPDSYEILFELGRVYAEDRHDLNRARNLWEAALKQWQKQEPAKPKPDIFMFLQIISQLALLDVTQGDFRTALAHMEMWKAKSPNPGAIQEQIEELRKKLHSDRTSHGRVPSQESPPKP
jgi:tetratricopeptide (TPR) repeat protein